MVISQSLFVSLFLCLSHLSNSIALLLFVRKTVVGTKVDMVSVLKGQTRVRQTSIKQEIVTRYDGSCNKTSIVVRGTYRKKHTGTCKEQSRVVDGQESFP